MLRKELTVKNQGGLHMRVAAEIVTAARKYNSRILISCGNCPKAEACSILQLLLLNASPGKAVRIEADGLDEEKALEEISNLFEDGSGI